MLPSARFFVLIKTERNKKFVKIPSSGNILCLRLEEGSLMC